MELSKSTRISKMQENIARGVIWSFAGLTIVILVWIVGYILYRGFYSRQYIPYEVLPIEETVLPVDAEGDAGLKVIVNKKIKLDVLTMSQLNTLFTKSRRENWGFYTQQDIKVQPFAYKSNQSSSSFEYKAENTLLMEAEKLSKYTTFVSTPQEMIEMVHSTPGAVGYLPADFDGSIKGVKTIPIRNYGLIFNAATLEVENNKKLQELDEDKLKDIFRKSEENWLALGGIDLPVKPALYDFGNGFLKSFTDTYMNKTPMEAGIALYSDLDKYFQFIAATPGAVGVAPYAVIQEKQLSSVPVIHKETGWNLTLDFLIKPPARSGAWGGISYIIINTLVLILATLLISTPIGVAAAIYLTEYAKQGPLLKLLRMGTETLAGIPSIVFGLFGRIFFVQILGMGIGFLSSTLTITLMILPTIVRTSEEALSAVPTTFREGSLALGATKFETIRKVVLSAASPGILTGVILGIGRVVGETAVLLYTLGSSYELVSGPSSPARVLSLHLYLLFSEAVSFDRAFATGTVLIFIILIVNRLTTRMISRMNKMAGS